MVSLPKVLCRADPSRLEGNRRDHRDRRHLAIETALKGKQGRVAIAALHGLRGVGKTVLAAAYADRYRSEYRATWWCSRDTATLDA